LKYADEPLSGPLVLYQCLRQILLYCARNSIPEVVIPDLGLDEGLPPHVVADAMAHAYMSAKAGLSIQLDGVGCWICDSDPSSFPLFLKKYSGLPENNVKPKAVGIVTSDDCPAVGEGSAQEVDISIHLKSDEDSKTLCVPQVDDVKEYMNRIFKRR
jgi:hypothetical protein